ncbi:MAG TPA: peptidase U32 [Firmicutes bacterium]|nr:peptidase U32 [Bacillota bacterium]
MKKPELLAPAGSLEKFKIAVTYGADAVYFGGQHFGLRAFSENFTLEEMAEAVRFAHERRVKAYVTVNIFPHNADLLGLPAYLDALAEIGVDALIFSDPGVFRIAREVVPHMALHVSTQANNVNWSGALFWQEMGVRRIVLARELSVEEIAEIKERVHLELEAFVHGAMCISYSGRCLLSSYFTGRDPNRGECAHICRWRYALVEENRPGQYFPIEEDERGTYIMNAKDLCLVNHIPALAQAGIGSFKIEGRMKSIHYVATVTKVYREAIDRYWRDPQKFIPDPLWREELAKISHRAYTTGFYFGKPGAEEHIYSTASYEQTHDFVGLVKDYRPAEKMAVIEQRNHMRVGDRLEIMGPGRENINYEIKEMFDQDGRPITVAPHAQQTVLMPVEYPVKPLDLLRRAGKRGNHGDR